MSTMHNRKKRNGGVVDLVWVAKAIALVILVIGLLYSTCSRADEWTTGQKIGEGVFVAATVLDWSQTRSSCARVGRCELNPMLGGHPSDSRINSWFVTTLVVQYLVADALPSDWRNRWIAAGVVMEVTVTARNANVGARVNW